MNVNAVIKTKVEVNPVDILKQLKKDYYLNECFIEDNKIYKWVDVGCHKADYEKRLVSEDVNKARLLSSIDFLLNELSN